MRINPLYKFVQVYRSSAMDTTGFDMIKTRTAAITGASRKHAADKINVLQKNTSGRHPR